MGIKVISRALMEYLDRLKRRQLAFDDQVVIRASGANDLRNCRDGRVGLLTGLPVWFVQAPDMIDVNAFDEFCAGLFRHIAMEEKVRFAIREGGRTVGAGVVTGIIE